MPLCVLVGTEQKDIDKINRHAVKIMSCLSGIDQIHLFQIPHHGSLYSFSPSLLNVLRDKTLQQLFLYAIHIVSSIEDM